MANSPRLSSQMIPPNSCVYLPDGRIKLKAEEQEEEEQGY